MNLNLSTQVLPVLLLVSWQRQAVFRRKVNSVLTFIPLRRTPVPYSCHVTVSHQRELFHLFHSATSSNTNALILNDWIIRKEKTMLPCLVCIPVNYMTSKLSPILQMCPWWLTICHYPPLESVLHQSLFSKTFICSDFSTFIFISMNPAFHSPAKTLRLGTACQPS